MTITRGVGFYCWGVVWGWVVWGFTLLRYLGFFNRASKILLGVTVCSSFRRLLLVNSA